MDKINVGIVGYGNVGRGVHKAIERNEDMNLVGIVTRSPGRVLKEIGNSENILQSTKKVIESLTESIDVAILCGGSATDLPEQGPYFAQYFNTVDSFDTHVDIPKYSADMDKAAKENGNTSIISAGWDPGIFSRARVEMDAILPGATTEFFYGLTEKGGISQGHSDAIRRIPGVKDARQYTHAKSFIIERVRAGKKLNLTASDRLWRECYVVLEEGADPDEVEKEIKELPKYFKGYDTEVNFVTQGELDINHSNMPHDGLVLTIGNTGEGNKANIEYSCSWESNPEATGSILVACARAVYRFNKSGKKGAYTMLDLSPADLSIRSREELLRDFA